MTLFPEKEEVEAFKFGMKQNYHRIETIPACPYFLHVRNNGADIAESNYWDSPEAKQGMYLLTPNAGALRLLVPESQEGVLREVLRATKSVVVSVRERIRRANTYPAVEIMFEDFSRSPYAIHLRANAVVPIPRPSTSLDFREFSIWTKGAEKHASFPGFLRNARKLPWMGGISREEGDGALERWMQNRSA